MGLFGLLGLIAGGALLQQAVQQEAVQEADLLRVQPHGGEGTDVHAANLYVLDAALLQGAERCLAGPGNPLGPNGTVKLVLYLQQAVAELLVVAVLSPGYIAVARVRLQDGATQGLYIGIEAVVTDVQVFLGRAVVAQVPHPQGGSVRQVQAASLLIEGLQPGVFPASQEAGTQCRRGAVEVDEQPGVAAKVADKPQVARADVVGQFPRLAGSRPALLPEGLGHGKVVMDAGNGLHQAAVAVPQAVAVYRFHAGDVGAAVTPHGDAVVTGHDAGHAGAPQQLFAQVLVGEAVYVFQGLQAALYAGAHRGDELEQRLRVVGGDGGVGQGRAQRGRVGCLRQLALGGDAQALFLDSPLYGLQQCQRGGV